MKVAILTRPGFRSPRILADSLKIQMEENGIEADIFYEISLLNRLVSYKDSKISFHFWLLKKVKNYLKDKKLLRQLKKYDAIIISECAPNGFLRRLYNVEAFKKIIKKPVGFYEVYYLGNAPTQIDFLKKNKEALSDRYDFHLSVSDVTEIKQAVSNNWFAIGIRANSWNLKPLPKKEIIAIVDFVQSGYEEYRKDQISALNKTGTKYISLEKTYSFQEIRNIYQQGAIFFIQFPEAFGISTLECLSCGCQIFTPESWWPMSWRLNDHPQVHGEGILPDCFTVYKNEEQLIKELASFKQNYDLVETPKEIFDNFLAHYPNFYYGNNEEVDRLKYKLEDKFL